MPHGSYNYSMSPAPVLPLILLVSDDLLFPSRIREALRDLPYRLQTTGSESGLIAAVEAESPAAIVVNLTARRYDPLALIAGGVRQTPRPARFPCSRSLGMSKPKSKPPPAPPERTKSPRIRRSRFIFPPCSTRLLAPDGWWTIPKTLRPQTMRQKTPMSARNLPRVASRRATNGQTPHPYSTFSWAYCAFSHAPSHRCCSV